MSVSSVPILASGDTIDIYKYESFSYRYRSPNFPSQYPITMKNLGNALARFPDAISVTMPGSFTNGYQVITDGSDAISLFDPEGTTVSVTLPAVDTGIYDTGYSVGLHALTGGTFGYCSNFGYDPYGYSFTTPGGYQQYYNPGDNLLFDIIRIDTDGSNNLMYVDIYLSNTYIEEFTLTDASAIFTIRNNVQSPIAQTTTWTNIVAFISGTNSGNTLSFAGSSPSVTQFCSNDTSSSVLFSSTAGFQIGTTIPFSLVLNSYTEGGSYLSSFSNYVNVLPGRFVFPGGSSTFVFYKNEQITPIALTTGLSLTGVPYSLPTLPAGLYFDGSGTSFSIKGVPLVSTQIRTYQFIGNNTTTGQSISTSGVSIKVLSERTFLTPASAFLSLSTSAFIDPVTFTASAPIGSYGLQFGWPVLPDGLRFYDLSGNKLSGYLTYSNPIILRGVPTAAAASLGQYGSFTLLERAFGPAGNALSTSAVISYAFGETVLFSNVTSLNLFKDVSMSFKISAASYYPSGSPIEVIQAASLPPGLSLSYDGYSGTAILSGKPTTYSIVDSYTFTAINANGVYQSLTFPIYVAPNDVVFSQPIDASYTFVIGRPLSNAITGYFPYPIQFVASAKSGCNVFYESYFDFSPYGLTFSSNGLLSGIPRTSLAQSYAKIVGVDSVFESLGSNVVKVSIIPDTFTFNTTSFTFNQNTAIPNFFIKATTFGEQQIQSYGYSSIPAGLTIDSTGKLSGTPTTTGSGTIVATATTAFSSGTGSYSYTISPDQLLLTSPCNSYSGTISVQLTGKAYSGLPVTGYRITGSSYGLSITSNGLLTGTVSGSTHTPLVIDVSAGSVDISAQLLLEGSKLYVVGGYGAPVFTAPTQIDYHWYLYVPIVPITFVASGYYFVSDLPLGITFNSTTGVLSGTPVRLTVGQTIKIYAKNNSAVSAFEIKFAVFQPFVARQQFSAGSYTAVVRESTLINAAQNAINNEVIPSTETTLGGLMAPRGPDVKTGKEPCCN
jgi:hypothetical protein